MEEESSDIMKFFKKQEKNKKKILSKEEIMNSIPKKCLKEEDKKLKTMMTEYRWRILKIDGYERDIVEISYKEPDSERLYINSKNEWIKMEIEEKYDNYVIDRYYYYTKKT